MILTKVAAVGLFLSMAAGVQAGTPYCGDLTSSFGPFDYRKRAELADSVKLVEGAHFTADVENGIKGSTSFIGGDLHYTLAVFPNHIRALSTLSKLALRTKEVQIFNMKWPAECYFNRAVRFAPDDGGAWAAYGSYLYATNKPDQAFKMFKQAVEVDPANPTINYNVGLAYFARKDYDNSLKHAQKAYAADYPLPGLKKKLIDAGKWVEPTRDKPTGGVPAVEPIEAKPDSGGKTGKPTE